MGQNLVLYPFCSHQDRWCSWMFIMFILPKTLWYVYIYIYVYICIYFGGFLKWEDPKSIAFNPKILILDDDWGYPHFRKPPYRYWSIAVMSISRPRPAASWQESYAPEAEPAVSQKSMMVSKSQENMGHLWEMYGHVWNWWLLFLILKNINDLQLLSRTKEFDGIDRDLPWTTMAMARIVMSISLIAETSGDDRF